MMLNSLYREVRILAHIAKVKSQDVSSEGT